MISDIKDLQSDNIFNELKAFIVEKGAVYDEEVTKEAKLEEDLGIYGDDAWDLLIAYSKRFNVDVTRFMLADYFSPEGDVILPALIRFLTGKSKPVRKVFTVGHLEKGIIAGKLDEDVINGN